MKCFTSFFILSFIVIAAFGCSDDRDVTGPGECVNLVSNPSFELNGTSDLSGWITEGIPAELFKDAPAGGGEWASAVEASAPPGYNSLSTVIQAPEGRHVYEFSFWARRENINGTAKLSVKKADLMQIRRVIGISSSYWTRFTVLDTITAEKGDSIIVELDGGMTEVLAGRTIFDMVELLKCD